MLEWLKRFLFDGYNRPNYDDPTPLVGSDMAADVAWLEVNGFASAAISERSGQLLEGACRWKRYWICFRPLNVNGGCGSELVVRLGEHDANVVAITDEEGHTAGLPQIKTRGQLLRLVDTLTYHGEAP